MTLRLTLVSRTDCHLCDELRAGVVRLAAGYDVALEEVDVDASPDLEARWGDRVPVLFLGTVEAGREICHHFLDEGRLLALLADCAGPAARNASANP
ncbi:MAG: glutaredoxin family protein [Casimicrobiaceae bacterium]